MRVRVVVAIGLVLVAGALALDMSRSAPRTAGSDHAGIPVFAATVPGGGTVCQPDPNLADDAYRVQLLIGTYGRPVPDLRINFTGAGGAEVARGHLPVGEKEGLVTIPLKRARASTEATRMCMHVGGSQNVVLGGEGIPVTDPIAEAVNGRPQPGRIGLVYLRGGEESWWQLLATLAERFGLGKASGFGTWTFPVLALLLIGVWVATVRLLIRELK